MDDTANVVDLLEELGDNIDDLETALEPLLKTPISTLSKNLAPLERAKLLTWLTYAIETILFSHIRLNGTEDPKSHPVMTELKRIQQYMQKVHQAENPVGKRENLSLNKEAAARFIKAGLAGNDKYDREVVEKKTKESEGARRKLQQLEIASTSSALPSFAQVTEGAGVSIILKKDQKSGEQVQGLVKEIHTKDDHPRGVKVKLQDGRVGRVQALVDEATASKASEGLKNLGRDGEPKKKRKADEGEEEEEEAVNSSDGDAMEVVQAENKKKTKKSKFSPETKQRKKEKKAKKQKEGG